MGKSLLELTGSELVTVYNAVTALVPDAKPVNKFTSKPTGAKRLEALADSLRCPKCNEPYGAARVIAALTDGAGGPTCEKCPPAPTSEPETKPATEAKPRCPKCSKLSKGICKRCAAKEGQPVVCVRCKATDGRALDDKGLCSECAIALRTCPDHGTEMQPDGKGILHCVECQKGKKTRAPRAPRPGCAVCGKTTKLNDEGVCSKKSCLAAWKRQGEKNEWSDNNLCVECGAPRAAGGTLCVDCAAGRLPVEGRCARCGDKELLDANRVCRYCLPEGGAPDQPWIVARRGAKRQPRIASAPIRERINPYERLAATRIPGTREFDYNRAPVKPPTPFRSAGTTMRAALLSSLAVGGTLAVHAAAVMEWDRANGRVVRCEKKALALVRYEINRFNYDNGFGFSHDHATGVIQVNAQPLTD